MDHNRVAILLEQIRKRCLTNNVSGLKYLSVIFRRMDTDFNQRLSYQELDEGLKTFGLDIEDDDLMMLFKAFDTNNSNHIDFLELTAKLRPPMAKSRVEVVNQAFDRLDANKDGVLDLDDLKSVYSTNAKKHPRYISGQWTEEQVLRNFLDSIDTPGNPDGKVTREEFMNYYAGVSLTVDDDSYFDLMMRTCYGLPSKGK